ncbi:MAG: SCO family protein [Gemmatimonadota bacterium]
MMHRLLLVSLALALAGCAREDREVSPGGFVGAELTRPKPKPEFVLTDMQGRPFDFKRETDGHVTLLFFGYTHCPDVCPLHMANIAAVLEKLPTSVTRDVKVVFVTTDPARDTPERLREWLGGFSQAFIGLTGTQAQIDSAQIAAGMPPAVKETPDSTVTDYTVGHSAVVLAYTKDGLLRVLYPFGTRQQDWARDIPKLVAFGE